MIPGSIQILLVDDNEEHSRLITAYLKRSKHNFNISTASTLKGAVEFFQKTPFDVVLLDLNLPDSNELNTVKNFCETYPRASVIVMTTIDEDRLGSEAIQYGAQDFHSKADLTSTQLYRSILYSIERNTLRLKAMAAERALKSSNDELEQFAFAVSHDLQAPLRHVSLYAQILKNNLPPNDDPETKEALGFIMDGVDRMKCMISDLLAVAGLNPKDLQLAEVNLDKEIKIVCNILSAQIEEADAKVEAGPLPTIQSYSGLLGQVFQNLIQNAIKFRDSERKIVVQINAEEKLDHWIFSIQDNGIGIDQKSFERIFKIFQRLHLKEKYAGTGIGLAMTKKIIDLHKGKIWVESEVGVGSTFKMELPKTF